MNSSSPYWEHCHNYTLLSVFLNLFRFKSQQGILSRAYLYRVSFPNRLSATDDWGIWKNSEGDHIFWHVWPSTCKYLLFFSRAPRVPSHAQRLQIVSSSYSTHLRCNHQNTRSNPLQDQLFFVCRDLPRTKVTTHWQEWDYQPLVCCALMSKLASLFERPLP